MAWYIGCALLGLADAGVQSQTYTVVGREYTGAHKEDAFAVFSVVQHLGLALAWIMLSIARPNTASAFVRALCIDGGWPARGGGRRARCQVLSAPTFV